jgi:hypothetical protein
MKFASEREALWRVVEEEDKREHLTYILAAVESSAGTSKKNGCDFSSAFCANAKRDAISW